MLSYKVNFRLPAIALILLILLSLVAKSAFSVEVVRHNNIKSAKESYQLALLKLALSYSSKRYSFQESSEYLTQNKLLSDLEQGKIDVAWVGTSKEYEDKFLPVRVPLFKGLLGHRIFLIRKGEQAKFDRVATLSQLAQLKAGQVASWTDAQILQDAGLTLVGTNKYQNLFYMLEGGRFDYLPRSVYSPWAEMQAHPELDITVEEHLMVIYPLPAYIFVNKSNQQLYRDIYDGLLKAVEDGQFDEYFYSHPLIKEGLERSKLHNRTVLKVPNRYLTPETPTDDARLWFDVDAYINKSN
ncbi:transporter substrate-binding domain-containing protein [Catenovulum sediminis]|uniref:Transporter substrate-binding domain-containing protein n=1 Tax=Catenovulum sediminis TaxID=1740262 RepID=A0ABV1RDY3_9ALTE|nr:transporter substrate-binding domain-containing protein [Catenovulum sediminis]